MITNQPLNLHEIQFTYGGENIQICFESGSSKLIPKYIEDNQKFYENECLEFIKKSIVRQGVFLDIGANIGNHTIFFSKIIGRNVLAFEVMADNYRVLCENVNRNRDGNGSVRTFNYGLGATNCFADFEQPNAYEGGSCRRKSESTTGAIEIKKLDDVLSEMQYDNPVAFMKIDVEGMEMDVLRGAINTLERYKPGLCIEIKSTKEYSQIYEYLAPFGYTIVGAFNATPTFVFEVIDGAEEINRLKQLVRDFAVLYIKAKGRD